MGALRKTHQRAKKNPYAERGLDKFALLSAELEQKREKLVAQLGSSLSIVRFAVGSDHHNWIPVIACPTLSSSEIHNLRGTAARLIAEDKPASSYGAGGYSRAASQYEEGDMQGKDLMILPHDATSAQADRPSATKYSVSTHAGADCHDQAERFLRMVGFIFSIVVDILRSVIFFKRSVAASSSRLVRSYSSWKRKETTDHPDSAAGMAPSSSTRSSSLPSSVLTPAAASMPSSAAQSSKLPLIRTPASLPADGIAATAGASISHPPAHGEAHKGRSRCKISQGRSSAPSTPRDSRKGKKSFQASASFPKVMLAQDEAPARSSAGMIKRDFLKSVSLPNASTQYSHGFVKSQTVPRSPTLADLRIKARRERSQNLGQALTGAGLALGLGGLVMGFIPAIVCMVCWWYGLPTMRRAVGDKPRVKSHPSSKLRATAEQ